MTCWISPWLLMVPLQMFLCFCFHHKHGWVNKNWQYSAWGYVLDTKSYVMKWMQINTVYEFHYFVFVKLFMKSYHHNKGDGDVRFTSSAVMTMMMMVTTKTIHPRWLDDCPKRLHVIIDSFHGDSTFPPTSIYGAKSNMGNFNPHSLFVNLNPVKSKFSQDNNLIWDTFIRHLSYWFTVPC